MSQNTRIYIMGHPFDLLTKQEFYQQVSSHLSTSKKINTISFANPEHVKNFQKNSQLQEYTNSCEWCVADGYGVILASKVLYKTPIPQRITGTDFAYWIACECEKQCKKIFIYGGTEESNKNAISNLQKTHPLLQIAGCRGWNITEKEVINAITKFEPNVLMVCLYNGMQEPWIASNKHRFATLQIAFGNGGAVDFLSGDKVRAPQWMQNLPISLEWLYRLSQDSSPKKLKQALSIPWILAKMGYQSIRQGFKKL